MYFYYNISCQHINNNKNNIYLEIKNIINKKCLQINFIINLLTDNEKSIINELKKNIDIQIINEKTLIQDLKLFMRKKPRIVKICNYNIH